MFSSVVFSAFSSGVRVNALGCCVFFRCVFFIFIRCTFTICNPRVNPLQDAGYPSVDGVLHWLVGPERPALLLKPGYNGEL